MYQVPHEEFYKLYDASVDDIIDYFYSEEELIAFIAKWYHHDFWLDDSYNSCHGYKNNFISQCTCDIKELKNKPFILFDNFDRIINIHDFEKDALSLYHSLEAEHKNNLYNLSNYLWMRRRKNIRKHKNFKYKNISKERSNYIYRQTPVPYTRKIRGGSHWSGPHTVKLFRMYATPEYKRFNRGSKKEIPSWWDDRTRTVQKSWKEQSKVKHQWEKNLNRRKTVFNVEENI